MMASLSLFLALLLAVSAGHKLVARERLGAVAARLVGLPLALGQPLLLAAAACELLAATALMVPMLHFAGALAAMAIWLGYGLALLRRRGEVLDCGCDLAAREKPVDGFAIVRPFVLVLLAGAAAYLPLEAWTVDAPFAALALLALWFAAAELSVLPHAATISQRNRT